MATSEAFVYPSPLPGCMPWHHSRLHDDPCFRMVPWSKVHPTPTVTSLQDSKMNRNLVYTTRCCNEHGSPPWRVGVKNVRCFSCKCQRFEGGLGVPDDGSSRPFFPDDADKLNPSLASEKLAAAAAAAAKKEKAMRVKAESIEEAAWELLRESIVYYCGHPVGTIAANDPSCSSILIMIRSLYVTLYPLGSRSFSRESMILSGISSSTRFSFR